MTTAQKSKETRRMESLFCISSQQSLHIRVASDYSAVMYVYVGIVGWIYRTKIPSFLFPYFFEQWSSLHLFSFHEMVFHLLLLLLLFLDNHISRTTQATAMISTPNSTNYDLFYSLKYFAMPSSNSSCEIPSLFLLITSGSSSAMTYSEPGIL